LGGRFISLGRGKETSMSKLLEAIDSKILWKIDDKAKTLLVASP
jgi:hypothetical protein